MNFKSTLGTVVRFFKRLGVLTVLLTAVAGVGATTYLYPQVEQLAIAAGELKQINLQQSSDQALGQAVTVLMVASNANQTGAKQQNTVDMAIRVANKYFVSFEDKKAFAEVIANESSYNQFDKKTGKILTSPTGAVGIAQLIPRYAPEFAQLAGYENFTLADLNDPEINMSLGAAFFRSLVDAFHGDYSVALTAYNKGKYSLSVKEIQNLARLSDKEAKDYLVRFLAYQEKIKHIHDPASQIVKVMGTEAAQMPVQVTGKN